ncbi:MAG TPA: ABC transporter permease [Bryobacteraceae bacterium]|jgi:predicted permease|nr:ABC transporter permease [Bryobacteraceae bacterium]
MIFALSRRWRQFHLWFHRDRLCREIDEELEHHFFLAQKEHIERGLTAQAAAVETRKALGNMTLAKEESRDAWGFPAIDRFMQDIHYSLRILSKNLGFSAVAIVSLALGIAGTTAIFSIVNALLLRPLPFRDSDRLVRITELYPKAIFELFQQHCRTLDIASVSPGSEFNLTGEGPPIRIMGSETSVDFFEVIGTSVERGRAFEADEDRPGIDRVVIVSHEFWSTTFHHDPDILGRSITLGGVNRRVIGVMPAGFSLPSDKVQVWIPARIDPGNIDDYWGGEFVPLIGRLRPGATITQARTEIHSLAAGIWSLFPFPMPKHWNSDSTVMSLQADLLGHTRSTLFVLLGAVGAVLVIACANVAGLLLARATARRKEIAMRAALGAVVFRIVRQLLTESIVLSFLAAFIGVLLGFAAISIFRPIIPAGLSGLTRITIDWRVIGFAGALSILTGLSFGIVPALSAARLNLVETVKSGSQRSATRTWLAMRSWLIAGEVALTLVLVLGGGLLVKSLYALTTVNPGFNAHRVLTMQISPSESFCQNRTRCVAFYNQILDEVRGVSGVSDAAVVNTVPLDGMLPAIPADVEDHPKTADFPAPMLWTGAITPNYLRLMQIPLLSGRGFTNADTANAAPVILITTSTAERFWPGVSPIGKHIKSVAEKQWRTIVGVVADVRQFDLAKHSPSSISGAIYMPYAQSIQGDNRIPAVMDLLVKTTGNAEQTGADIRRIVADASPDIPVGKIIALQQIVGASIAGVRSTIFIFLSFAAAALILAAVGIYGLMSYSVSQRTYEISLRIAIGATSSRIVGLILAQSVRVTLIGILAGLGASLLLGRLLSGLLSGVSATDPIVLIGVCLFLIIVSIAATSIPAWRAAHIDPMRILRAE